MKPYSKKYLTLALAGVLAASIPVSAFAEGPAGEGNTPAPAAQPATPAGKQNDQSTNNRTEAQNSDLSDISVTIEKGDKYYLKNFRFPEGATVEGETYYSYDSTGKRSETIRVKFKDNSVKDIKINFNVVDREDEKRLEKLNLTDLSYDGTYIKGYTSAFADIYVKDNDNYRGFELKGSANASGKFEIKYDIKESKSVTVYAKDGNKQSKEVEVKNNNYKHIKGTKVEASDLRINGNRNLSGYIKGHAFDFISIYLNGEKIGTVRADKNAYFRADLDKDVYERDLKDLTFYTDAKTVENKKFKVTEALEGQKLVKGTANTDDEITVYDANGKKISNTYVNNAGVFTAFLDRALINGETIKIEARDKDKNITKIEYKVTKNAVEEVKAIAYIKGYPDGTFKPQANVTRAEAAQMFATLLNGGTNFGTSQATKFSDASDDWYSKAINYVVGKGLISGYPNGTFKPNESITRAEFAQMISGYVKNEKASTSDFKDVKDHWAKDAIDKLYGNKNVNGYPDGSFKPNAKITRAEAVTILNSVFNRNTNKSSLNNVNTSSLNKFSDVNEGFWAYYNILDAANTHNRERLNSTSEVDMWK